MFKLGGGWVKFGSRGAVQEGAMDGGRPHRFSSAEYHRMAELGILHEDSRVELIRGQIVDMAPIGTAHIAMVNRLNRVLAPLVAAVGSVSVQNPIRLGDGVEPEPDIAVLRLREDDYEEALPRPEDVLLLIEVADSSLPDDRGWKADLYAAAGIQDYWIANLIERVFEVRRLPRGGRYQEISRVGSEGVLEPLLLPGVRIRAAALLRPQTA
jgi:Uma2 family endonuclease